MHYVILRDDDTNALTPVECLERLYRPFLHRGLPVNLATVPKVRTDTRRPDGKPEGFLIAKYEESPAGIPISESTELVKYLRDNSGYHVVQHGYDHSLFEFDKEDGHDIGHRLDEGARLLQEAGFKKPQTFVAPYDRLSGVALREVAQRYRVLSTGWFELRRLPLSWWPRYSMKKFSHRPHWQVNGTKLLTHPGCLLSCHRSLENMLNEIRSHVRQQGLTVLVTHWWEYFRNGEPDEEFIAVLHQTAQWLASEREICVTTFDDLAEGRVPLR
jgi:hypothetical protein